MIKIFRDSARRGFTIIEVLVAIALTMVVGWLVSLAFNNASTVSKGVTSTLEYRIKGRAIMDMLESDIRNICQYARALPNIGDLATDYVLYGTKKNDDTNTANYQQDDKNLWAKTRNANQGVTVLENNRKYNNEGYYSARTGTSGQTNILVTGADGGQDVTTILIDNSNNPNYIAINRVANSYCNDGFASVSHDGITYKIRCDDFNGNVHLRTNFLVCKTTLPRQRIRYQLNDQKNISSIDKTDYISDVVSVRWEYDTATHTLYRRMSAAGYKDYPYNTQIIATTIDSRAYDIDNKVKELQKRVKLQEYSYLDRNNYTKTPLHNNGTGTNYPVEPVESDESVMDWEHDKFACYSRWDLIGNQRTDDDAQDHKKQWIIAKGDIRKFQIVPSLSSYRTIPLPSNRIWNHLENTISDTNREYTNNPAVANNTPVALAGHIPEYYTVSFYLTNAPEFDDDGTEFKTPADIAAMPEAENMEGSTEAKKEAYEKYIQPYIWIRFQRVIPTH